MGDQQQEPAQRCNECPDWQCRPLHRCLPPSSWHQCAPLPLPLLKRNKCNQPLQSRCRQRGLRVVGETLSSALAQDESRMWHPDFKVAAQYVMSPPIRSK